MTTCCKLTSIFLLGFLFLCPSVWAQSDSTEGNAEQDSAAPTVQEQAENATEDQDTETDKPESEDQNASNGNFIPSEEISEDLPVSYPVDI